VSRKPRVYPKGAIPETCCPLGVYRIPAQSQKFKVPAAEADLDALVAHVSNSETSERHYQRYLALRVCHYIEEAGLNRQDFLNYLNFLCA
jgi:hypothetical protein